jgi:TetR/AcrR family transcriptional regulator, transcriptional repressor for nem operon
VARNKSFDPDVALDRAVALFRTSGYEAISTADLCNAMGVARQSLYDTFGDKANLYRLALKRYQAENRRSTVACFEDRSPLQAIQAVFESLASLPRFERRCGCMLVNAVGELVATNADVAVIAKKNQVSLIQLFSDAIRSGQLAKEIDPSLDADIAAAQLVTAFYGIRVLAKTDPGSEFVASVARSSTRFLLRN